MQYKLKDFIAVGKPVFTDKTFTDGETKKGDAYKSMKLIVRTEQGSVFTEMFGMKQDKIPTFSKGTKTTKGKAFKVAWDNRADAKTIEKVANFRKVFSNFGKRKEYIASWDLISLIEEKKDELKDEEIYVRGEIKYEQYEGNVYRKHIIKEIGLKTDKHKNGAFANLSLVFTKDALDKDSFEDEKRLFINGWVESYDSEKKENVFLEETVVLDGSKIDFSDKTSKQVKIFNYLAKYFTDKKIKSGKYYEMGFVFAIISGAEKRELTEEDLTDEQLTQIELGITTMEDIEKSLGSELYGEKMNELRLLKPSQKYPEGVEETEYTDDDFIVEEEVEDNSDEDFDFGDDISDDDSNAFDITDDDLPF